jgi:hypothetical protein
VDSYGQIIFVADAHRDGRKRFIVSAREKLTAFLELERITRDSLRFLNAEYGRMRTWSRVIRGIMSIRQRITRWTLALPQRSRQQRAASTILISGLAFLQTVRPLRFLQLTPQS